MMKIATFILIVYFLTFVAANRVRRYLNYDGGRIVGGEEIRIEEVPYQASLLYFGYHICGGSIISQDFIITAAHCTSGRPELFFSVRVGSIFYNDGGEIHNASRIYVHASFNRFTFDFDVSLIKLKTWIKLNNFSKQAISLPRLNQPYLENTAVLVSGWGETRNVNETNQILRAAVLAVSNQLQCHLKYISDGGITPRMICAIARGADSCSGDSGGPLRGLADGTLIGIVSFGPGNECAYKDFPGVYTRVAAIRTWIFSTANI